MTRITNFGRKRTYLEAGFEKVNVEEGEHIDTPIADAPKSEGTVDTLPKKKSRKRRKSGKASAPRDEGVDVEETHVDVNVNNSIPTKKATSGGKRKREEERHAKASESRRIKRKKEREASITCLACRKKGHIVKDCPQARTALLENDEGSAGAPGRSVVGVCYRCGSTKHSLSRCKKPTNPKKPLPFASCFVCSGKGHLASSCPKNQGKGIYPNGGSCKLCGQTSHLAKDCELRSNGI
ncbi:hypothetical protein K439DRAFT_1613335 [Ramaria rubella]|nr:hypothetical protein K439DRAFT_1613335 [Ramaria rubella]